MPTIRYHWSSVILTLGVILTSPVTTAEPVAVGTRPLAELTTHPQFDAPAAVISLNDSQLSAEVAAVVKLVAVETGSHVKPGATLVELDPWEYQHGADQIAATLDQLQANLELARKQVERSRSLNRDGHSSRERLDQAETELKGITAQLAQQRAALATMRLKIAKCRLTAPFAGVVTKRSAQVGMWASPGLPLINLTDTAHLELSAQVDTRVIPELESASEPAFTHNQRSYPLILRGAIPQVDPATHSQEVRFTFGAELPLPGTVGRVIWHAPGQFLPGWLPVKRGERFGVFTVVAGRARFHPLPAAQEGRPVPLPAEISGAVIVEGRNLVQPDQEVTLIPPPSPPTLR